MAHQLRRSVVIGLGGTGLEAVLHVKHKFWQVHGNNEVTSDGYCKLPEDLKGIRFLVFDTTEPRTLPTESGAVVALEKFEFVRLNVQDPTILLRQNREIKDWYPDKVPARAIFSGAGQIRALGRLALFANSDQVYRSLNGAFQDVRNWQVRDTEQFDYVRRGVSFWLVGSLAGGTGSGTFLDLGFLIRNIIPANEMGESSSSAILLLPDVFTSLPASDNVEPNAYGALRELDYFMEAKPEFAKYSFNDQQIEYRPPFDVINLVNNRNLNGDVFNDVHHMTEVIGSSLFVSMGSAGQAHSDIWDNLRHQIDAQGYWDGNKKPQYSSFGVSELLYDGQRYSEIAMRELAIDLVARTFLSVPNDDIMTQVENFLDSSRVREENADHVIDDLLLLNSPTRFGLPRDINRQSIAERHQARIQYVETQRAALKVQIENNLSNMKTGREKSLDEFMGNMIRLAGGINQARQFTTHVRARVQQYHDMMLSEAEHFGKQLVAAEANIGKMEDDGRKLAKAFIPPPKTKIEAHLRLHAQAVDQIVMIHAQIERRKTAAEFFGVYDQWTDQWQQSLEGFNTSIKEVNRRLLVRLNRDKTTRRKNQPFIIEVEAPMPSADQLRVSPEAFLQWLDSEKPQGIVWLINSSVEQIEAGLLEFCAKQDRVLEIKNRSIEDVLKMINKTEAWNYVSKLYEMAVPLWTYDKAYVSGKRRVVNILQYGVPNSKHTMLDLSELKSRLPSEATIHQPSIVDTGDNRRIICINSQAALPAYAIHHVKQRYREPFADEDRPFTYHIHRDWDAQLPDLIPPSETEEQRTIWSLSLADPFGLVKKIGSFYEVRSEKFGEKVKDYWMRLDNGRGNSMRKLLENNELIDELRDQIDTVLRRDGNANVLEGIIAYREKLKSGAKTGGPGNNELRMQINAELEDIDKYVNALKEI